jgi:DNA invertase Pin-like site-specific DNA recombinase
MTTVTTDLPRAARTLRDARKRLETAMAAAEQAAIEANANGTPETEIARQIGVNRMTVRRWLKKL